MSEVLGSADISLSVIKDDEAKKSATDFIVKEDNSIIIGDMTTSTLGTHTVIDDKGMLVKQGDDDIVRFGIESEFDEVYSVIKPKEQSRLIIKTTSDDSLGDELVESEIAFGRMPSPIQSDGLNLYVNNPNIDKVARFDVKVINHYSGGGTDIQESLIDMDVENVYHNGYKIGEVIDGTTPITKVPNGSQTTTHVSHVELSEGTYIVSGRIGWAQNATGFRALGISDDPSIVGSLNTMQGHATHVNYTNGTTVIVVPKGETKTVYLNARQNSGSEITISNCWLKATRII